MSRLPLLFNELFYQFLNESFFETYDYIQGFWKIVDVINELAHSYKEKRFSLNLLNKDYLLTHQSDCDYNCVSPE